MASFTVKYVQKRGKAGWRYRRKTPPELREILGKTEIVIPLGRSEATALKNYPKVHASAERLLGEAMLTLSRPHSAPETKSALEQQQALVARLRAMKFDPLRTAYDLEDEDDESEWSARSNEADQILERYPVDPRTGDPVGVKAEDLALVRALNGAAPPPPQPTLDDAKRLYLKERIRGDKKKADQLDRVMGLVEDAIGRKRTIASLSRPDAREVRDHMLAEIKSPSSVDRYLNVVRAVVNLAITEFDLRGVENRFKGLAAPRSTLARDQRHPFTADQLSRTRARVVQFAGEDLRLIWRILEGTGCRLAEVTGLLVADVHLDHKHPYLDLVIHPHRRLKTQGSVRRVPLVGDALEAAREAVRAADGEDMLFPAYGREGGNTAASAALMKHVRACVTDRKVSVHSLRHNMKDRLIAAGVPTDVQNLILGHSTGAVSEAYGGAEARLEAAAGAMAKAAHRELTSAE